MNRLAVLGLFIVLGCGGDRPAAGTARENTAARDAPSTNSAVSPEADRTWDDALGPVLATPGPDGSTALVFARDSSLSAEVPVELFTHDARVQRAVLQPAAIVNQCAWLRRAALARPVTEKSPAIWSLALSPGVASPLAIDAVGDLSPRDSAAIVIAVTRLVTALPDDSVSAPFRGLPVSVRDAWRMALPDGTIMVAAIAMRVLNVESNPRAEIVVLLAEAGREASNTAWTTRFTRREAGPEDSVVGADLLAALVLAGDRTVLAFVRESDRATHLDFVERAADGSWRLRWSTAALPCAR